MKITIRIHPDLKGALLRGRPGYGTIQRTIVRLLVAFTKRLEQERVSDDDSFERVLEESEWRIRG